MRISFGIVLGMLLAVTPAFAAADLFEDLQEFVSDYNSNLDKVPGIIKWVAGTEKINIEIGMEDGGKMAIGIATKNGAVEKFERGGVDKPTLSVKTGEKTVRGILESGKPASAAVEALNKREITYESTNIFTGIKMFFGRLGAAVLGRFVLPANFR